MRNIDSSKRATLSLFCILTLVFSLSAFAQVGINTTDPKTQLDVNGGLSLREGPPFNLSNGANSNLNLGTTPYSQYRISGPTAAFSINNIVPLTGADGQMVTLINTTTFPMTIRHNMGAAGTRILCPADTDLILTDRYSAVTLQYNTFASRWMVQGYSKKSADLTNVTDITRYIVTGPDIEPGFTYSLTVNIPGVQAGSTGIITITGNWSSPIYDDITIHNIEMRTGQVRFAVSNNTLSTIPTTYPAMDFNLTIIR